MLKVEAPQNIKIRQYSNPIESLTPEAPLHFLSLITKWALEHSSPAINPIPKNRTSPRLQTCDPHNSSPASRLHAPSSNQFFPPVALAESSPATASYRECVGV